MVSRLIPVREAILAGAILVLLALVASRFAGFVAPANLANVFNDTAPLIILALGQMVVILTRCIDLSVAANLALTGMTVAMTGSGSTQMRRALPSLVFRVPHSWACRCCPGLPSPRSSSSA